MSVATLEKKITTELKRMREQTGNWQQQHSDSHLFTAWFDPSLFNRNSEKPLDYVAELEKNVELLFRLMKQPHSSLTAEQQTQQEYLEQRVADQLGALQTALSAKL